MTKDFPSPVLRIMYMTWEFEVAYSAIDKGGLLLSDDVLANDSFSDFCISKGLTFRHVYNLGAARSNIC